MKPNFATLWVFLFFCTAVFFTGIFMFMVLGIMENALVMYLKEKKPTLIFFKDGKGLNRFLRKEREDPVIIPGKLLI